MNDLQTKLLKNTITEFEKTVKELQKKLEQAADHSERKESLVYEVGLNTGYLSGLKRALKILTEEGEQWQN